jgi:hypothetical protein
MADKYWSGFQTPQDYWDSKYTKAVQSYLSIQDKLYGTNGVAEGGKIKDSAVYKSLTAKLESAKENIVSVYKDGSSKGFSEGGSDFPDVPALNQKSVEKLTGTKVEIPTKPVVASQSPADSQSKPSANSQSKAVDFYQWARENAKRHGANSDISAWDKSQTDWILSGYKTWGDVLQDAKQKAVDAQVAPEKLKSIDVATEKKFSPVSSQNNGTNNGITPASDVDLERMTQDAKDAMSRAKTTADAYPVGSKQYKAALADYSAAQQKLDSLPKTSAEASQTVQNKASSDDAKSTQQSLAKAQQALDDAKARATDFPNDPSAQADVKNKQAAFDSAQSAAGKAGTTATPAATGSTPSTTKPAVTDPQADLYQGGGAVKPSAAKAVSNTKTGGTGGGGSGAGGGGSAGSTGGTGGTKKPTPPVTPPNSADAMVALEAKYGVQASLVDSDPSLKALFKEAQTKGYTAAEFKSQFLNTDWAKSRSDSAQQAETARLESPGTYTQAYEGMRNYLARLAVSMGENLTPADLGGAYDPAKGRQNNLVEAALDLQWGNGLDETKMRNLILGKSKLNTALPGGEAGGYMSQLKSLANDYGMNSLTTNNSQWLQDNAQSILLGKKDINTVKQEVIDQAKLNYKPYANQLDAGVTLRGIATPYLNTISNLLEVPAESIDLSSPTGYGKMVSNALMGSDPTNPTPMTLNAFETQVKQDPRWASTDNARDTVMGGVGGLLKLLGKVS